MLRPAPTVHTDLVERKQATVLFVDIVESTAMIAGLDAEEAMMRLNPVMTALSQAARQFNGTILRSLGDGLKVAFGAPRALEGHAILACRAALAMQEAVQAIDNGPAVRIGLHSGEVVAGDIDTGPAVEQAAQGMTVHIASRIEQFATPGGICISDACFQLVRGFCDTVPLGVQALRGVPELMAVHKLIGLRPAISSEQFRNAGLTPFQSREAELAILDGALGDALRGQPGVVGISAPAGVGKSRLCYEFGESCRRQSIYVLEARCLVHGQATPMLPIIEMLRALFRIAPPDEPRDARAKIEARLRAIDPALADDASLLFSLLGLGDPSLDRDPNPRTAQAQLRKILASLIKDQGQSPGLIIFEDLHWLDPVSSDLLEAIVEATANTRILILLNFRPEFVAPWLDTPRYRVITLQELNIEASDALVRDLIGDAPEVDALRAQVAERCGGNPFFAEELVRSLVQNLELVGSYGNYRTGKNTTDIVLPATVEAVIGARIDRLSEQEKLLLQVGATIGKEFGVELLGRVVAMPPEEIDRHLYALIAGEFIQQRSGPFGPGFGFKHPLIQQVAYAMQLRARRRQLHADVAKAIAQFPWGQLDEVAGDLARHCEAAGDNFAAAQHLRRSAFWTGRTNSAQALRQWKKVHALLVDSPPSAENDRLRAEACGGVLGQGWREGIAPAEAKQYADEAIHYARDSGDPIQGPMLRISYGRILLQRGPADKYVDLAREALSYSSNADNPALNAFLRGGLAQGLFWSGNLREALSIADAALAGLHDTRASPENQEQAVYMRQRLGFEVDHWLQALRTQTLAWLGRFADAQASITELEQFPDRPASVQYIPHHVATEIAYWRGDPLAGKRHAAVVADYAERTRLPYLQVIALISQGRASATAGDFGAATTLLRQALDHARRTRAALEHEAILLSTIAEVTFCSGDAPEAAALAAQAISVAAKRTNRLAECHASLVRVLALLEPWSSRAAAQAQPLLAQAEQLVDITGASVFEPMLKRAQRAIERSHHACG